MDIYVVNGTDTPDFRDKQLSILSISKQEVGEKVYERALHTISQLEERGSHARNSLAIVFEYDDVPEEIFEVFEIREWVAGLLKRVPHLFYFITQFENNHHFMAACLANVSVVKTTPSMTTAEIEKYLAEHGSVPKMGLNIQIPQHICNVIFKATLTYADKVNDDIMEVAYMLSKLPSLIKNLDPSQCQAAAV